MEFGTNTLSKIFSPANMRETKKRISFEYGESVRLKLTGYTTKDDQKAIIQKLNYTTSDSIGSFLKGYNNNQSFSPLYTVVVGCAGGVGGGYLGGFPGCAVGAVAGSVLGAGSTLNDPFFTQLESEYCFPEKETLLKDTAKKYYEYLQNNNNKDGKDYTKQLLELKRVLDEDNIDSTNAGILDRIIEETI